MATQEPFHPDERYDREQASDGVSRFGAYLAQKRGMFLDFDGQPTAGPLQFAAAAWEIALPPIMSPGYLAMHPRVQSAEATWDYDQYLAVTVEIAVPDRPVVARMHRALSWSRDPVSGQWYDPQDCSRVTALCLTRVRVPIPEDALPLPDYQGTTPHTPAAQAAVAAMCRLLNRELSDMLDH